MPASPRVERMLTRTIYLYKQATDVDIVDSERNILRYIFQVIDEELQSHVKVKSGIAVTVTGPPPVGGGAPVSYEGETTEVGVLE